MKVRDRKKEIKIYINGTEKMGDQLLYKALIDKFIEIGVTGCTILRSNSGYGSDMIVKYGDDIMSVLMTKSSTVIITVIESDEKIEEIVHILDSYMGDGIATIKEVEFIRYTRSRVTPEDREIADSM